MRVITLLFAKLFSLVNRTYQFINSLIPLTPAASEPNEAAEFRNRYLAQQSWFDSIASFWVSTSLTDKLFIIVAVEASLMLTAYLFMVESLLLIVVGSVLLAATHYLLYAHEQNRIERAELFTKEHHDLINALSAQQTSLSEGTALIHTHGVELAEATKTVTRHAGELVQAQTAIETNSQVVLSACKEVRDAKNKLLSQQNELQQTIDKTMQSQTLYWQIIQQNNADIEKDNLIFPEIDALLESIKKHQQKAWALLNKTKQSYKVSDKQQTLFNRNKQLFEEQKKGVQAYVESLGADMDDQNDTTKPFGVPTFLAIVH